jgi:hypothetical protein
MKDLQKTASALFLLACDATPIFAESIWLPSTTVQSLLPALQRCLRPRLELGFIGSCDEHWASETMAILSELEQAVGKDSVDLVCCWIDEIYVRGVPDRAAEMFWTIALSASRDEAFHPNVAPATNERLGALWLDCNEASGQFRGLEKSQFPSTPSNWDSRLKPGLYDDWTDVRSAISEIAHFNRFLFQWERRFGGAKVTELEDILRWGREAVEFLDLGDVQLAFPGSWRYGRRISPEEL